MSQVIIDSKDIAEIRNALTVIQLNVQPMVSSCMPENRLWIQDIIGVVIKQIKRIDKLLPKEKK